MIIGLQGCSAALGSDHMLGISVCIEFICNRINDLLHKLNHIEPT